METVSAKTILTRVKDSSWFGLDYNMNLYRGCCHGCMYCDSRSDCYHIDRFDTVRAKENALTILRDDLRRKIRPGVVGSGSMSDPYNPFERETLLSRHALELIDAFGFGAALVTKSDLVARDADVLRDIAQHSPVLVKMTVTTTDDALAARVEPRAPRPSARLEALRTLARQGIFCGVLMMPVLPLIEDSDENILAVTRAAKEAGARFVYPFFGVTLRQNQREWYYDRLDEQFPGLRAEYVKRYGERYNCVSPRAKALWKIFTEECDRLGLLWKMQDIIAAYRLGYSSRQLSFFE